MVFETTPQGIVLRVRLQPNSSCCKLCGTFQRPEGDEYLKINIVSIPEKGKANKELIAWLSKQMKLSKSDFRIISGELDRYKKILITADKNIVLQRLHSMIGGTTQ